jgi:hypothetical protein
MAYYCANISCYSARGRQRYIDSEEAHRLCADGSHEWRCVSCGKGKGEGPCLVARDPTMAVFEVEPVLEDDSQLKARHDSDTSLTVRDMECNVGITKGFPGEPPVMGHVRQARARIRYWAKASQNNRSVIIVPPQPRKSRRHSGGHT